METESDISLGGTMLYPLSLRKDASLGKDMLLAQNECAL